ncbi:MAG: hypothetical protein AB1486_33315 [Planctomycetota bacterium]
MSRRIERVLVASSLLVVCGVLATAGSSAGNACQQETEAARIPLTILYVGMPDTDRQKDFVTFLSQQFSEVRFADLDSFKEDETRECDVVILDKDGVQWGDEGGKPLRDLKLSPHYSRPTMSLGIPGAFFTDSRHLRTGYM